MTLRIDQLDWQSVATLVTGLTAGAAATIIGLKQMRIGEAQAEILKRQAEIAALSLKHDLFERRYEIYNGVRDFLLDIIRYAAEPKREVVSRFVISMEESRLHFRPEVHEGLRAIWERANAYFATRNAMEATFARLGNYGDGNPALSADQFAALERDLTGLVELFGDELRLAD